MSPAVPRQWPGETFVILGGGPSLTKADVAFCRGKARVIAIKQALHLAPWADVLYFCDRKILEFPGHESEQMRAAVKAFQGLAFTLDHFAHPFATVLQRGHETGLSLDPTRLNTGGNSGYQAVNLAVLLGAAKIVLVGFDMKDRAGVDHWFGSHPWKNRPNYRHFLERWPSLVIPLCVAGVQVVNTTKDSALTCFPYEPLAIALAQREVAA